MANFEDFFDEIIRIGYGKAIIPFLFPNEANALGCVNKQCAEAVRWQREKGNIAPIWHEDKNHHVSVWTKNGIIKSNFPVGSISMKSYNMSKLDKFDILKYTNKIRSLNMVLDESNKFYVIKLNGKYEDDGYGFGGYSHVKEIIVDYSFAKVYFNSYKFFKIERQIRREKEKAEEKRLEEIKAEEERKRIYKEKTTFHIPAGFLGKPNPWKQLPKVEAMKL